MTSAAAAEWIDTTRYFGGGAPFRGGQRREAVIDVDTTVAKDQAAEILYFDELPGLSAAPRLRCPLMVHVNQGDEMVMVFAPALSLGGTGADTQAALRDLVDTASALRDEYESTPADQLGVSAKRALDRIRIYFR